MAGAPTEVVIGVWTINLRSDIVQSDAYLLVPPVETKTTEQTVAGIGPDKPSNMRVLLAFEWTQAAPQSCFLNDAAPKNM